MELVQVLIFLRDGWEVMAPLKGRDLALAGEDGVEIEGDVVDHAGGKQAPKRGAFAPLFILKWGKTFPNIYLT